MPSSSERDVEEARPLTISAAIPGILPNPGRLRGKRTIAAVASLCVCGALALGGPRAAPRANQHGVFGAAPVAVYYEKGGDWSKREATAAEAAQISRRAQEAAAGTAGSAYGYAPHSNPNAPFERTNPFGPSSRRAGEATAALEVVASHHASAEEACQKCQSCPQFSGCCSGLCSDGSGEYCWAFGDFCTGGPKASPDFATTICPSARRLPASSAEVPSAASTAEAEAAAALVHRDQRGKGKGKDKAAPSTAISALAPRQVLRRDPACRMAHVAQNHTEALDARSGISSVDYCTDRFKCSSEDARARLGKFGISGTTALQLMSSLSGGQKARVSLTALTWSDPHILLLDEPTNHLDMSALTALAEALRAFDGAVVLVVVEAVGHIEERGEGDPALRVGIALPLGQEMVDVEVEIRPRYGDAGQRRDAPWLCLPHFPALRVAHL